MGPQGDSWKQVYFFFFGTYYRSGRVYSICQSPNSVILFHFWRLKLISYLPFSDYTDFLNLVQPNVRQNKNDMTSQRQKSNNSRDKKESRSTFGPK